MYDLDTPRFTSSQVARAAGMSLNTFRTNFMRGHFQMVGESIAPAERHGVPHHFGLRDAIGFAIVGELVRCGVGPRDAWEAAMWGFAHTGTEDRNPGELFNYGDHGMTMMLYWPATKTSRVVPMALDKMALEFGELFMPQGYNRVNGVVVVMLDFIYKTIVATLEDNAAVVAAAEG
ncbi:hypothetical protein [Sphingomonas sp. PvP015]|uniref:hypothetical protein n=1 Tax=Sphingomonas sp. PvP015 TaxID=3156388 RepID=UPI003399E306